MSAKPNAHDEPRLLIGRPPHAMARLENSDGRGDYTSRPYKAMRGEPEAVADRDLAGFVDAAHATDADRADARVKRENRTLRRCTQAYGDQFNKLRHALHDAEALSDAERSLNLARRIAHDLEKLGQSLT
jgi:hypothetical protein